MEYNHGRTTQFQDLPAEIIVQILSYLDFGDAVAISRVNVFLKSCLVTSQKLQYHFASQAAGVTDNYHCRLDFKERLQMLRRLDVGWTNFQRDFHKTLHVLHEPFGIYDLTGGIYLMGDISQKVLHYCKLPCSLNDPVAWSRIDLDSSLAIVDVGLSVYEHDLIAVVTTQPTAPDSLIHKVEIQLLEFSTGKAHPLARNHVLFVRDTLRLLTLSIGIEIVGEYLALVTTPNLHESSARFCVFEWKTGAVVLDYPVTRGTYCSVVFLSPTHIILPNGSTGTLDLFIISTSDPNPQAPSLRLALPSITPGYSIRAIYGRAEPNLAPTGLPYSTRPFHPVPEDAIAIFKLHIRSDEEAFPDWGDFSMFAHRSTLLRLCEERDGGKGETVPWEQWGPPVTRWIDAAIVPWWITTSTGQRCVLSISPDAVGANTPPFVMVLDFNPLSVKKALAVHGKYDGEEIVEERISACVDPSVIRSHILEEDVESALPYVSIIRFIAEEAFDGVLMDEERLLGLVTDEEGRVKQVEVFHIAYDSDRAPSPLFQ